MSERKPFAIATAYDTETTNYGTGEGTRAFVSCYMFNDLRAVDLRSYEPDIDGEHVEFLRTCGEAVSYIDALVSWGVDSGVVPIVCAYNLMFDMQTLMFPLSLAYGMECNAQSSTNVYTLDLLLDGELVLRFWDTYHLEMRGLSAMGETCGIAKATGDWDYTLIRTPETPLTAEELFYAKRDVQVIPAYLRYLLDANEWMEPEDLGCRVLTKTSIVRQMARKQIGALHLRNSRGHRMSLLRAFELTCARQMPRTYEQYALRKASFRGGFTFTAANTASVVVENVASLDVTSMHHTFINGRYIPIDFTKKPVRALAAMCESVLATSRTDVLKNYHKPFKCAFHARLRFENIRLREGSPFEEWGIALIPEGKFKRTPAKRAEWGADERARAAEAATRASGWHDTAREPVFAFGKLMSATECTLHVSELELWCISRVYEWDALTVVLGEGTRKFRRPPDYVTLQSNLLFETKSHAKIINKRYREGEPYPHEIPATIPEGIAEHLRDGTCSAKFFESYYNSTVKGMFNGIYGTMAQDVFKPSYAVEDGELHIDEETVVDKATWDELQPDGVKVLYTYGLRIVGGSRMHLVIAMELLYAALGGRVRVTGGDTDSMKVSCDADVADAELSQALTPIYDAATRAINVCMKKVREDYPRIASTLDGIGGFEVESCGKTTRYAKHMEAWNKARISLDSEGHCHITCAGLSRPLGAYHIENWLDDMIAKGVPFETLAPLALGYNVRVSNEVCHALQKHQPRATDTFEHRVTDYLGNTSSVAAPQAVALYPTGRELGETVKRANMENTAYLSALGRDVDMRIRSIEVRNVNGKIEPVLKIMDANGVIEL
nr:MAG TPA: DNA polymerase B [Bacteriophage sp.]